MLAEEGVVVNAEEQRKQKFNKEGTKEANIATRAVQKLK